MDSNHIITKYRHATIVRYRTVTSRGTTTSFSAFDSRTGRFITNKRDVKSTKIVIDKTSK